MRTEEPKGIQRWGGAKALEGEGVSREVIRCWSREDKHPWLLWTGGHVGCVNVPEGPCGCSLSLKTHHELPLVPTTYTGSRMILTAFAQVSLSSLKAGIGAALHPNLAWQFALEHSWGLNVQG